MSDHKPAILDNSQRDTPKQVGMQPFDSAALDRLMGEVRNSEATMPGRYNRMHNRHNR